MIKLAFLSLLKGKDHFGDLGIDGRIILKWIERNTMKVWAGFM
jgi:hypothetical protein